MIPESKKLVQDTWKLVAPISDTAAQMFYKRLFGIDPAFQGLFAHTDMHRQGQMLTQMLGAAVAGLDHPEHVLPVVEHLGKRHLGYGVLETHYDSVGAALLWTLEQGLGQAFTPAVRDAWAETYVLLSTAMKDAARGTLEG